MTKLEFLLTDGHAQVMNFLQRRIHRQLSRPTVFYDPIRRLELFVLDGATERKAIPGHHVDFKMSKKLEHIHVTVRRRHGHGVLLDSFAPFADQESTAEQGSVVPLGKNFKELDDALDDATPPNCTRVVQYTQ